MEKTILGYKEEAVNTASLELCKELYGLSKWGELGQENTSFWYSFGKTSDEPRLAPRHEIGSGTVYLNSCPAYDSGYLLRKLQHLRPGISYGSYVDGTDWGARANSQVLPKDSRADTPEDALCKLAIELYKQGLLP